MTADQEARCAALAKRIAELDPSWAQEGMACRDPNTLLAFRWRANLAAWLPCAWSVERSIGRADVTVRAKCKYVRLVEDRAIAAGPDYTDQATLGCLLLSLGGGSITVARAANMPEYCIFGETWQTRPCQTRAEAILAAKVAQLEAK